MLGKGLESLIPQNPAAQQAGNGAGKQGDGQVPGNLQSNALQHNQQQSAIPNNDEQSLSQPQNIQPQPVALPSGPTSQSQEQIREAHQKKHGRPENTDLIFHIELEKVRPNPQQPRRHFNEEAIKDLASSIREFGLLQPIVVTKIERETPTGTDVEYQLIAGERRWLASKMLGLERVPAIIRNVDLESERLELAIIENIQREELNPIEKARAFNKLQDEFRLTQREIASKLGKSRETVANTMRLLDLPAEIMEALEKGKISESHGRLLLAIENPGTQNKIFRELLENKMTTRDLKNRVRNARPENENAATQEVAPEIKMMQEKLSSELGAPVKIESHGERGQITITFFSPEELQNIVGKLGGEENQTSL